MPSLEQIGQALRAADAAGNTDDARRLAQAYADMRRQEAAPRAAPQIGGSIDPTEGMSGFDKFAAGMGKSFADAGRGLKQTGTEIIRNLASDSTGLTDGSNAVTRWADKSLARQQSAIDQSRVEDAALMDTGAGLAGNIMGYGVQALLPAAGLRGTSAARALLPSTLKGNAALGGIMGLTQPVATGESRLANGGVGALAGAGGVGLAKLAGAGVRTVGRVGSALVGNPVTSATDKRAAEFLIDQAGDRASLMQPAPSSIPGVQRTLGEEVQNPAIARLERQMRGQSNDFEPIDLANNAARVRALEAIAGNPADRAAAETARDTVTGGLRNQAYAEGDQAIAQANQAGIGFNSNVDALRSQIEGIASTYGGRPAVRAALTDVSRALRDTSPDVKGLYQVRQTIGDLLSGKAGSDKTYAQAASKELLEMRDLIDNEIAQVSPSFAKYLQSFRDMSKPINRMDVGDDLLERSSGGAVLDRLGNQQLTPAQFSKKARDLDAVAARATGFKKSVATDILSPDDIKTITGIQDDLERQYFRSTAGSGGNSMTDERARLGREIGRNVVKEIPIIGGFAKRLEEAGDKRLQERLSYLLANPAEARRVIQSLDKKGQKALRNALYEAAGRVSQGSAMSLNGRDMPLEIDIVGGTPIPVEEAKRLYGRR